MIKVSWRTSLIDHMTYVKDTIDNDKGIKYKKSSLGFSNLSR